MVPLPRYRGGGCRYEQSRSRGAFFLRPSLGKPLHESVCLQKNKREAERRQAPYALLTAPHQHALPPADAPGAARATPLRRSRRNALRARSPLGAPSRLSSRGFRLHAIRSRPRVTPAGGAGVTRSSLTPKPSTWHPDPSVEGVDTRTARERGDKPRPQEPQPAPSIGCLRLTSLRGAGLIFLVCRRPRIQDISPRRAISLICRDSFLLFV